MTVMQGIEAPETPAAQIPLDTTGMCAQYAHIFRPWPRITPGVVDQFQAGWRDWYDEQCEHADAAADRMQEDLWAARWGDQDLAGRWAREARARTIVLRAQAEAATGEVPDFPDVPAVPLSPPLAALPAPGGRVPRHDDPGPDPAADDDSDDTPPDAA